MTQNQCALDGWDDGSYAIYRENCDTGDADKTGYASANISLTFDGGASFLRPAVPHSKA